MELSQINIDKQIMFDPPFAFYLLCIYDLLPIDENYMNAHEIKETLVLATVVSRHFFVRSVEARHSFKMSWSDRLSPVGVQRKLYRVMAYVFVIVKC